MLKRKKTSAPILQIYFSKNLFDMGKKATTHFQTVIYMHGSIGLWNNSILPCMFCCNCVFECMSLLWKQIGSNIINGVFLEEYRNENLKFHTSLLMASPMTIRTEQNNVCIDLIRYRSSSYIQQLHTCVLEREKCGHTKDKKDTETKVWQLLLQWVLEKQRLTTNNTIASYNQA